MENDWKSKLITNKNEFSKQKLKITEIQLVKLYLESSAE